MTRNGLNKSFATSDCAILCFSLREKDSLFALPGVCVFFFPF